jgi:two-component system, OmpR family, response regulator
MSAKGTILVVDDDAHIREVVSFALRQAGFEIVEARDGREALEAFARVRPALLVLDILMPELDGTEVCRELRKTETVPIVFLSSRDDEIDRVLGLELGGDDYVTKPFSPRELVARVRAVLRRHALATPAPSLPSRNMMEHGRLRLDLDRFEVSWDGQPVVLTVTEFGLLRTLMGYPGKVYSRDELSGGAYDFENLVTERTIDSHVRRIRKKLKGAGGQAIETVHGLGYKLADCS